ncbi:MAG: transcription-repair coupling factor [Zetaproteobacteria bacterium CG_4_9_14_3_um_filter_49_83]|nr:MAG: transcription-repair coupling factor [Zetaproteobacteria bacterium CG1_02_49_23]PIQ34531.1 MAG: transcription-repair coupling factor [Zetaproteobacteria bacterium CG17_big_fil_post_rev_8_21_14_2_50_50_13]PIY55543.1 MAG: transcription-repair coupling factor [Zetaproteobacteria bacterium CG_4_10_14_0_8_um_filter_49_80]PJA35117.1 MAG: transcription-repair coupling factor [Zetaproteobacteria bacterium CG_4_9_14_3_um_filter_49_83]
MKLSENDSLSPLAYQLSQLARQSGLHVWICHDLRQYRQLSEALAFFLQDVHDRLWSFPAWEVLPYDRVSPHHAIVGERFSTLGRLLATPNPEGLLITSLPAWMQRIAPPETIAAHVWQLQLGQKFDLANIREKLVQAGMIPAERVLAQGEFAARGGLFDIWPATEDTPLRIDLFGDEIESIRRFDPETQRSTIDLQHFTSAPVREVILDEQGQSCFAAAFRARFPQHRNHPMLSAVLAGRPHPGIEALLPLTYASTARLLDYLPESACILAESDINEQRLKFSEQIRAQFDMVKALSEPSISPQELYATETPILHQLCQTTASTAHDMSLENQGGNPHALNALRQSIADHLAQGWRVMLVAHGLGQQERMLETLQALSSSIANYHGLHDWPKKQAIATAIGGLDQGLILETEKLLILTGRELLGQRLPRKRGRGTRLLRSDVFSSLSELKLGDAVVHEDHGVGRYLGLKTLGDEESSDFIQIEYADKATVFVPVDDITRLHRYTGDEAPSLNKLGSEKWKRTRERVQRDLLAMAHELIEIEAARKHHERTPYAVEGEQLDAFDNFCTRFPFEGTDDQVSAIDAIMRDLAGTKPMDRVICGDVGFGKTEVAMRAAFIVANAGHQVAILAPTTVLANQHFNSFNERFAGTGLSVELVSRLQGKKDTDRICQNMASGKTRIIVGTHRLLSDQFKFANIGMLIIDEEQRFGVKHKQKLKALHASVDVLTLSATPIPRTLHQTLSGLRTVSIISTPPAEREAIRTMVSPFDRHLANEAIRRELYRGGQIYYLHNHVQSIGRIAQRLREDIPEAEIGIAHGQMTPSELDRQMMAFYEGRLHMLVCTTIVESGLDVPNANTLIIERADLLGLSQLHQIRGRVGRSHRQAFAYLFTPDPRAMTADARERLQAIAEHTELGAGFLLARQDMEIRGAGNLLGSEQSGKIEEIGLDMYMDMLSKAVAQARGQQTKPKQLIDLNLGVPAILAPDYIPQAGERLNLYRRIAQAENDDQLTMLFEEMTDRFGKMPTITRNTLELARIRWRAQQLYISVIRRTAQGIQLHFTAQSPIDPGKLMLRVQQEPNRFRLTPDGHLSLLQYNHEADAMLKECIDFMDSLL